MRFIPFIFAVLLTGALAAQVPQAFNYQAVSRDANGNVLSGQAVGVRLSIHSGSAAGPIAYQEVHTVTTNAHGLFSLAVGQGSVVQGAFAAVPWGADQYFLQVELDPAGGSTYVDMGTSQLLSVPYALHAGSVDCPSVSLLGDTVRYANGCYLIQPGMSAANGGCLDLDNDGFYDRPGCGPVDCDDAAAGINPGASEVCGNGVDDDCDGASDNNTDPGAFLNWYPDSDGDGYGNGSIVISACAAPTGHVTDGTDCDDTDANIFPGQGCSLFCSPTEAAWVDQNQAFLYQQADALWLSCISAQDPGACLADQLALGGQVPLGASCLQCLAARYNCITANCLAQCVSGTVACQACIDAAGCDATFLQCMGIADSDGDGWADGSDCGPNDATIHPNATETCGDGIDSNCDGILTEGEFPAWPDLDQDGFGSDNGMVMVCSLSAGQSAINGDCDDSNANVFPGALELCGDGVDNDCNGTVDENCLPEICDGIDNDGDGLLDADDPDLVLVPCELQSGVCSGVTKTANLCVGGVWLTCAASDYFQGSVLYEQIETSCDGLDNDCDGVVDGGGVCTPCVDNDLDGFTTCAGDCDDTSANVFPGAPEVCGDGVDNDCDGLVDEGCGP